MSDLFNLIIFLSVFIFSFVLGRQQHNYKDLKKKLANEVALNYDENLKPIIEALLRISSPVLSDSKKLDRLARGADYVDKFDWMESDGNSELVNPEDVNDFAKNPSLSLITTYGEDRLKEENIKRNLFKTAKDPFYSVNEYDRKENRNSSSVFGDSKLSNIIKKLGFSNKFF